MARRFVGFLKCALTRALIWVYLWEGRMEAELVRTLKGWLARGSVPSDNLSLLEGFCRRPDRVPVLTWWYVA